MSELYEKIKAARKEMHLSQDEVAKYMELNRTAIVEIESGKRKISSDELKKFSELFGMSADTLLYGDRMETPDMVLLRNFALLDERDKQEILGLIEFKRIRKERGTYGYKGSGADKE